MPKYYCDYCDTYLTHDSAAGRMQHLRGWKHVANFKAYYQQLYPQWTASHQSHQIFAQIHQSQQQQQQQHQQQHQLQLQQMQMQPPPPPPPGAAGLPPPPGSAGLPPPPLFLPPPPTSMSVVNESK